MVAQVLGFVKGPRSRGYLGTWTPDDGADDGSWTDDGADDGLPGCEGLQLWITENDVLGVYGS